MPYNFMIKRAKIFCVIPAYNEEENIAEIVRRVKPLVDKLVVVDDGSSDKTGELAEFSGAITLRHILNRGQGAALRTGTEYAIKQEADIIVHFDADGQFLSADIKKLIAPIVAGQAQVVFGSRFLDAGPQDMPGFKRYVIMPLARAVNKLFFNINLTDPQSGFRAMSRQAAEKINWRQDKMAHCSEIMFQVIKNKFTVKEVPITVIYRQFGQNLYDGLKIIKDLFIALLVNQ